MVTEVENEMDEVFDVVKRATEAVALFGSRVSLFMEADVRPGFEGDLGRSWTCWSEPKT